MKIKNILETYMSKELSNAESKKLEKNLKLQKLLDKEAFRKNVERLNTARRAGGELPISSIKDIKRKEKKDSNGLYLGGVVYYYDKKRKQTLGIITEEKKPDSFVVRSLSTGMLETINISSNDIKPAEAEARRINNIPKNIIKYFNNGRLIKIMNAEEHDAKIFKYFFPKNSNMVESGNSVSFHKDGESRFINFIEYDDLKAAYYYSKYGNIAYGM